MMSKLSPDKYISSSRLPALRANSKHADDILLHNLNASRWFRDGAGADAIIAPHAQFVAQLRVRFRSTLATATSE